MREELRRATKQAGPSEELQFPEEMEFNLSDFALFLSVMKNREAHRNVLSIIMEEPPGQPAAVYERDPAGQSGDSSKR